MNDIKTQKGISDDFPAIPTSEDTFKDDAINAFDALELELISQRFEDLLLQSGYSAEDASALSITHPKPVNGTLRGEEYAQEKKTKHIYDKAKHDVRTARNIVGGIEQKITYDLD